VEDYEQKMRDAVGELLLQVAAGEISAEEAQREMDIVKNINCLVRSNCADALGFREIGYEKTLASGFR
jgi:hypothetical protein